MFDRISRRAKKLRNRLQAELSIQYRCKTERHGSDYGGWTICPTNLDQQSIIYSFGIGDDITFDLSLIEHYKLSVFAFDPTPKSIEWLRNQELPEGFHAFDFGIADYDGQAIFYPPENPSHISHSLITRDETADQSIVVPVYRLQTTMDRLGHKKIDVLKMDVEGAEYDVINDIAKSRIHVDQILVEFHHRFANLGMEMTQSALRKLNRCGYKIFYISPSGFEYSVIYSQ